jgi:hypothetical protein
MIPGFGAARRSAMGLPSLGLTLPGVPLCLDRLAQLALGISQAPLGRQFGFKDGNPGLQLVDRIW